ncbi:MAG: hypothetical protein F4Y07_16475 [Gemmatimonadetes bacterium]|nr:hypothetical protein [Gemmatimonadota bacterium]
MKAIVASISSWQPLNLRERIDQRKDRDIPRHLRELRDMLARESARFEEALKLGVTIRMLAPVLAEAFINLIIFLLAKSDIKSDQRLYQDIIRRGIDVRVKSLHINCNGFAKAVATDSIEFKAFQTLMNKRNDFLHGNVDPTVLRYDVVHFDYRTIPVFEKRASFGELALSHRLIQVEPERALEDFEIVTGLVAIIMECLEPKYREAVSALMRATSPGWRPKDGRVGILFPEHTVHSVLELEE